jgi:hypothetical protein
VDSAFNWVEVCLLLGFAFDGQGGVVDIKGRQDPVRIYEVSAPFSEGDGVITGTKASARNSLARRVRRTSLSCSAYDDGTTQDPARG